MMRGPECLGEVLVGSAEMKVKVAHFDIVVAADGLERLDDMFTIPTHTSTQARGDSVSKGVLQESGTIQHTLLMRNTLVVNLKRSTIESGCISSCNHAIRQVSKTIGRVWRVFVAYI